MTLVQVVIRPSNAKIPPWIQQMPYWHYCITVWGVSQDWTAYAYHYVQYKMLINHTKYQKEVFPPLRFELLVSVTLNKT